MAEYLVTWEISIEAETPEDAARQALDIQRDPESLATYFTVKAEDDTETTVDFDAE